MALISSVLLARVFRFEQAVAEERRQREKELNERRAQVMGWRRDGAVMVQ